MVRKCQDLRDAVALCLQRSECVMVQRHTPKECYENPELNRTLPEPCLVHIFRYIDCKRGQADMSKRFRGNGPASTGRYAEDLEALAAGRFDAAREVRKLSADEQVSAPEPPAAPASADDQAAPSSRWSLSSLFGR